MVLAVLIAFGVVTGGSEGLKASQSKARREEHRSRKNNLILHVPKSSEHSLVLESRRVVLSGEKVSHGFCFDVFVFFHPFPATIIIVLSSDHSTLALAVCRHGARQRCSLWPPV